MNQPNIVFFFTDDQRFDTIGNLNNPEIYTPNLDQIVSEGTTFVNSYIMGGSCGAVCMPSRGMLHTGKILYRLEKHGQFIPEKHALLGETLKKAGYTSFGTGKWHNGIRSYARSFNTGAEIFFGGMADHWNVPACDYDPTGNYPSTPKIDNPHNSNKVNWQHCNHITAGKHSTDLFADATINFIENQSGKNPFFAYVSFMAPHDPRSMPEDFLRMYDQQKIEIPENFAPEHSFNNGWLKGRDELLAEFPRTKSEVRRHIAEYYGMISHLDAAIGRVMNTLRERGILDNTIILFAGDNGLAVGQHGLMGKQNLYDHSVHIPFILAGPNIPTGEKREALIYLIDIFPTLCDLIKIQQPTTIEGKSLAPHLAQPTEKIREYLHFAYEGLQRGVRNQQYKLIEYVVDGRHVQTQLFDLLNDPRETVNLSKDNQFSGVLNRLRNELKRWQTEYEDNQEQGQAFWTAYQSQLK